MFDSPPDIRAETRLDSTAFRSKAVEIRIGATVQEGIDLRATVEVKGDDLAVRGRVAAVARSAQSQFAKALSSPPSTDCSCEAELRHRLQRVGDDLLDLRIDNRPRRTRPPIRPAALSFGRKVSRT